MNLLKWIRPFGFAQGKPQNDKKVVTPKGKSYNSGVWVNIIGGEDKEFSYKSTWVNTAVAVRAENTAKGNILLYRKKGNDVKEIIEHPFLNITNNANIYQQTFYEILYLISASLDVYGKAFVYVAKNTRLEPVSFLLLPTANVKYILNKQQNDIEYYEYRNGTNTAKYTKDEIIYFKLPKLGSSFDGEPTISACKTIIDIDNYQQLFQKKFFINDGSVNVVLESDEEISEETFERLNSALKKRQGADNSNSYIILDNGLKYKDTNTKPKEIGFGKSREAIRDELLGKLRCPKTIIGLTDTVNRATANVEMWNFIQNVIKPFSRFIIDKLNIWIKQNYGKEYFITIEYETPADPETDIKLYDMLLRNGVVATSEVRQAFGFSTDKPDK